MKAAACLLLAGLVLLPPGASAATADPYAAVDAAPVKTSIYLGTVSLQASRFLRHGRTYAADYRASVFPCFFLNESGRLLIQVPEDFRERLAHGLPFNFSGSAVRRDGRVRPVTGRVTPLGPRSGRLKVRVIVNRYVALVFNSTYQLAGSQ